MRRIAILVLSTLPLLAQVKLTQQDGRVDVDIDGKPFTSFFYGKDAPKPYLYPLRSATGTIVTRHYPIERIQGESHDHPHHRGLWITHGDVNGYNFWASEQEQGGRKGYVVLDKLNRIDSGPRMGLIDATFNWNTASGKTLMKEQRVMRFYGDAVNRIIDFSLTFTAVEQVKWGDTKEGMFAIRLADELSEKKTGTMTNAEGAQKEKNVWGKPSPWVDYAGTVQGQPVAVAIFDSPQNPRHPTTWHSRDYGLFAANMFGLHDFNHDKLDAGSLTMKPGETLRLRYRVVIHPGPTDRAKVEQMYQAWSNEK